MIHDAEDHAYVCSIIARHTKAGAVNWPLAADYLGMDLAELRAAYDLDIPEADPQAWQCVRVPGLTAIRNHPQGAPLRRRLLEILGIDSTTAPILSERTGASPGTVRDQLRKLSAMGMAASKDRKPRLWSLTTAGRQALQALSTALPNAQRSAGGAV